MSLETIAPPVDESWALAARAGGGELAVLERGRKIYLADCISCHSPEPIDRYSLEEWEMIMPEMAIESKLTPGEEADVTAYVFAAKGWLAEQASEK